MSNDPLMNISNLAYVESFCELPSRPGLVSAEWQATFQAMPDDPFTSNPALEPAAAPSIRNPPSNSQSTDASHTNGLANGYSNGAMRSDAPSARPAESDVLAASLQERLIRLVRSYRVRGHLIAKLDPLVYHDPRNPSFRPFMDLPRGSRPHISRRLRARDGNVDAETNCREASATYCEKYRCPIYAHRRPCDEAVARRAHGDHREQNCPHSLPATQDAYQANRRGPLRRVYSEKIKARRA